MLLFAAILGTVWIGQWLAFVFAGTIPQLLIDTGGSVHLVAALDLSMVVPPLILGAIGLLKNRPWGYLTSIVLLVQCTGTAAVLIVTSPVQAATGIPGAWDGLLLWLFIAVGCMASVVGLLKNMRLVES
ncbi:MAG: hypothetical protein HZB51_26100 [Chloroflexi bacterium]|nr:hypothetical protein [Chloroflexota bacterium]